MVVGLPLNEGDEFDGKYILLVSLTLSCPFLGCHRNFLGEWLTHGSGRPWIRPTDNGEGKHTRPLG